MKRLSQVVMDRLTSFPIETDKVLHTLGVEPRRTSAQRWAPCAGGFGAGFAVGVGVGLFAAPKAGKELRTELRDAIATFFAKEDDEAELDAGASHESAVDELEPARVAER